MELITEQFTNLVYPVQLRGSCLPCSLWLHKAIAWQVTREPFGQSLNYWLAGTTVCSVTQPHIEHPTWRQKWLDPSLKALYKSNLSPAQP